MKKIIVTAGALLFCLKGFAQSNTAANDSISGTFQIEVVNSRNEPYIPGNIREIVIEHRLQHTRAYYPLDNNIRVKILSRDEINAKEFVPLPLVSHVNE